MSTTAEPVAGPDRWVEQRREQFVRTWEDPAGFIGQLRTVNNIPIVRRYMAGMVEPPLTDWSERAYIAGELPNRPADLVRWISDPQVIEPGTAMPALDVPEEAARHIAAYLYTIGNPTDLGPRYLLQESWLHVLGSTSPRGESGAK